MEIMIGGPALMVVTIILIFITVRSEEYKQFLDRIKKFQTEGG